MMRLSTMWKIDRTVDAEGRSPIAERILENWAHDRGSARHFRSSANFVYACRRQGHGCYLRFADSTERSRAAIEAEIALLGWLAAAGVEVDEAIPSRRGTFVETVETELGTFHSVLFAGLEGRQFEIADLDAPRFREWGAALGRLHAALRDFPGSGSSARGTWRDHLEFVRAHVPGQPAVRQELDRTETLLGALPVNRDTYGLIHFDFELDNLYWHDHAVGILDFDDCSHHWYAADIAFALRDLFADGVDLGDPSFRAFVCGYTEHSPLDDEQTSHIPLFLRFVNLVVYARIARGLDLPRDQDYPDWLEALDRRLRQRMAAYTASLEDHRS